MRIPERFLTILHCCDCSHQLFFVLLHESLEHCVRKPHVLHILAMALVFQGKRIAKSWRWNQQVRVEEGFGAALTSATLCYLEPSSFRCYCSYKIVTVCLQFIFSLKLPMADHSWHVSLWDGLESFTILPTQKDHGDVLPAFCPVEFWVLGASKVATNKEICNFVLLM